MPKWTLLIFIVSLFEPQAIKVDRREPEFESQCENSAKAKRNFAEVCVEIGVIEEHDGILNPWDLDTCECVAQKFTVEEAAEDDCKILLPVVLGALERIKTPLQECVYH